MARVLLVDDDGPLREMLALSLHNRGHEVTEAETGREGLRRFNESPADVVVTDLVMPEQDGIGLLLEIRKISPGTPIIVMSGGLPRSELYRDLAAKLGATRVLAKPFGVAALEALIVEVLSKSPS